MTAGSLDEWQRRLETRFAQLRAERDAVRPGGPLFALEHGLSLDSELPQLQDAVRRAVLGSRLSRSAGLPFVVYAAEIGYQYRGDEYWPVFEEATPNWTAHGIDNARRFIRHRFEEFADTYGGARISGRWALWFKNIAWPITHAVLSKDLQRHLARLLYDYRMALTSDLLDDHAVLGEHLARRSQDTSARFRNFAENTELLGLVAAALLVGEEEDTQLLSSDVLHRIVTDLSMERQAGAWLLDAKHAAVRVRRRGWIRSTAGRGVAQDVRANSDRSIEATLSLRRTKDGWKAYVLIPSYESLAQRLPGIRAELERTRYRVHGVSGLQPRGALFYDRGPMPFDQWPSVEGQSLVELDTSSASTLLGLLADHCRLPAGPWLFRVTEPGVAVQVRTRTVRPSADYVLVTSDRASIAGMQCNEVSFATEDATATSFRVPPVVEQEAIDGLLSVGLSVAPEVGIGPVGFVPAAWDGEGTAEWPAGEHPLIAVRSTHSVSRCIVSTETEAKDLQWPDRTDTLFLQVADLESGSHSFSIVLVDEKGAPITQGSLMIRLREPVDSSSSATARQGMQVKCFPPHPTLKDLWSGASRLEVTGPDGERAQFEILMTGRGGGTQLGSASFSSQLPVDEDRWSQLLRGVQGEGQLGSALGESEEMVVRVEHAAIGASEVRAGRPFEPLRWATGHDRQGPFARLINHTAAPPAIRYFPPEHPAIAEDVRYDEGRLRFERGGLVLATCDDLEAATIIAPHVSGGLDALRVLNVHPSLQTGPRTAESVRRSLSLARRWGELAAAADATAEIIQQRVLEAISSRLGGLIGGQYWWQVERQLFDGATPTAELLLSGIGRRADERGIAQKLLELRRTAGADEPSLTEAYIEAVATRCRWLEPSLAALVSRLAQAPETLAEEDSELPGAIQAALDRPAVFRLARLLVACRSIETDDEQGQRR